MAQEQPGCPGEEPQGPCCNPLATPAAGFRVTEQGSCRLQGLPAGSHRELV